MEDTLLDVSNAIRDRRERSFKRLKCFVVNYSADFDFPHKFWYPGCSVKYPSGKYCARSNCDHGGVPKPMTEPMYRLKLQLTDRSPSAPVHVTIFDQAQVLLGMGAQELSRRSQSEQLVLVKEATSKGEPVEVWIKVKADLYRGEFGGVVQVLFRPSIQDDVMQELFGTHASSPTPTRSLGEFHTPRGEEHGIGSSSGRSSSAHQRRTGVRNGSLQLSSVKTKLQDLIEIIDLTHLED